MGLISFGTAAVANGAAAGAQRQRRALWTALALFYCLLFAEMLGEWRYVLLREAARAIGLQPFYRERQPFQAAAIVVVLVALAAAAIWRFRAGGRRGLAVAVACGEAAVFAVEGISLHQTDAVLWRSAGPVLLIGWLWLAGGVAASALALGVVRRRRW